jgi:ABC-type nitrate/sulfonate/bicarbonate transport system permease component
MTVAQPSATPSRLRRMGEPKPWMSTALGILILLVVWTIIGSTIGIRDGIPTPWSVLKQVHADGWSFYWPNLKQTLSEAIKGYVGGNVCALLVAVLILLVPRLEGVSMQLAVASYCLPIVAIGPILVVALNGSQPQAALAGLAVFFTTLVGTLLGLRSADPTSLDLVTAYGGGRWKQLKLVRFTAALPATFAALKLAAPAALLGAIIGEYLGGLSSGLGIAMIASEQSLAITRTWGIALVAGAVAGIAYFLIGYGGRLLTPWADSSQGSGQ